MDFFKGKTNTNTNTGASQQQSGGGLMDKFNNMGGGGQAGEQKEDYLDKGVDFVQERMGQGPQNNESAIEQAKDEQISDAIRRGYKSTTGKEVPIADK
ncbi:hypothetical protein DFP72DRAFT_819209 [Ephemerocybe angulata]|uniref:Uncharacterized protein n=1 Tax=Ephemerocybe angulata TaxID=980116 RepID=A0A8H6HNZ9_9AGAR|nr:hypothetical protein DFP72DRAFT_830470 [Tulosesus angulatus]KAF6749258.1 hypothetical protein DFP72DRAFT_819209 [Tulosesus angulatus]